MSSFSRNASHVVDQVRDGTSGARDGFVDLGVQAMKVLASARAREAHALDAVLERIGLQRRESAWRPVWLFAAGAVVAGAAALLLAPTAGKTLRANLRTLVRPGHASDMVKPGVEERVDAALAAGSGDTAKPSNGVDAPRAAHRPS